MGKPVRTQEEWEIIAAVGGRGNKVRGSKLDVWLGRAYRTPGGCYKSDLMLTKTGSVVFKSKSAASKTNTKAWTAASAKARASLGVGKKGKAFQAMGGKTKAGKELLTEARKEYVEAQKKSMKKMVTQKKSMKKMVMKKA